ncbi:MAG: hypothetical protein QOJ40_2358 [Verrucomicrobiota bacterium]
MMKTHRPTILLIDDDRNDRFLTQRALRQVDPDCLLQEAESGDEAIAYLKGLGRFHDRDRHSLPRYIITDLQMPDGDGFEILHFLKHNSQLSGIPIVVLSASAENEDIRQAYALGASAFLIKTQDPKVRFRQLRKLHDFFSECEIPEPATSGHSGATQSRRKPGERFSRSILSHPALNSSVHTKTLTRATHRRTSRSAGSHASQISVFRHQTAS